MMELIQLAIEKQIAALQLCMLNVQFLEVLKKYIQYCFYLYIVAEKVLI